jgi:hypothetical protein
MEMKRKMSTDDLKEFLVANIKPLKDSIYGDRYRAAARIIDGTYLPCVVFQRRQEQVNLALRRFDQLQAEKSQYRAIVESFVTNSSHVAEYDLSAAELSPFAWPLELLNTIHGETAMGRTAFVAEMKDGTMHSFGTSFRFEFFELPEGYSYTDIATIHSGMIYSVTRGLCKFSMEWMKEITPYREKPFFTCYLKDL